MVYQGEILKRLKTFVVAIAVTTCVVAAHADEADDALALAACLIGTLDDPLQRLGLDVAAVEISVDAIAAAGERVLLIHIAVDADDDNSLDGFAAVTQRGGIPL